MLHALSAFTRPRHPWTSLSSLLVVGAVLWVGAAQAQDAQSQDAAAPAEVAPAEAPAAAPPAAESDAAPADAAAPAEGATDDTAPAEAPPAEAAPAEAAPAADAPAEAAPASAEAAPAAAEPAAAEPENAEPAAAAAEEPAADEPALEAADGSTTDGPSLEERRLVAYVSTGVAVAALATSAVFGYLAWDQYNCLSNVVVCNQNLDDPVVGDELFTARAEVEFKALVADMALLFGAAAVLVAATGYVRGFIFTGEEELDAAADSEETALAPPPPSTLSRTSVAKLLPAQAQE